MMTSVILRCFLTARTILITKGATNRFLEDLSPDIPRDWFFKQFLKQKMSRMIILVI